ncbi:alanine--tRNA ligase [Wenyingzhuangia sp. 2_MG-2023]|uniref:alanine--tRNA ligase n=1 Tax=Wenyingzhuangia sp. 2_MG-2023 TaxID=3062639 RepID=UPI0026E42F8B|nr:alanine--tRNA ligase [Wenyingzhuangia sp. 2_MG-2023]MDO6738038.1 alanine--tRNA ligase [Wenyingzhuangia sp. 2_MG-2023]MDO6802608.1 alanine--tRNA ligase [Wenyingzhuangia sp. 1_MG-2023]
MKSQDIRKKFLEFFESKQHKIVPSASMILKDDPTLMFVNSGMAPLKEYFLGQRKVINSRVTDSQKCLRVSGKHNDLEEVGIDTYHHTLFEMLGNWSFGDYFKKEAIAWAWELLTEVYKMDKDSLYVTIFEGDASEGLVKDTEAYDMWTEHIAEDRILLGDKKDNFWEMGAQGPCGPCSEIHVDIRSAEEKAKVPGADLVNMDHPQVVEIWNLVFMQFNRKADGSLENLPNQHIDTGMGFERLCMALQGVQSNYDTDVFTPLIHELETKTGFTYGKSEEIDIAIRVISDHVRAVAFAIADGQLPSSTGAGYVIRRILRRAIRYGFTFLNQKEPFIYQLVDVLSHQMGDAFPEINTQKQLVRNVMKEEEASFLRTLGQGLGLLDDVIAQTKGKEVSGDKAFELYDTFGFPIDLTGLILSEKGYTLNEAEFEAALQKQKNRSRAAAEMDMDDWVILKEDSDEEFIGYDYLEASVKITRYRKVTSKKDGELYQLVFNLTPFYPEGGGQVGDRGFLEANNGNVVHIVDTKKENNLIMHIVKHLPINPTDSFKAVVDVKNRESSNNNHSATHLLHQALRTVLGTHVEQKGSLVNAKHLRFDFSHFAKVTADELVEIEEFVNARIREKIDLKEFRNIPIQEAIDKGAMALFGEKYGDTVRMIQFKNSKELCGGTHVANTANIWHFKITGESAVAAGVRRIEAITGNVTKEFFKKQDKELVAVKASLKNVKDPVKAITSLQDENTALKKEIEALLKEKAKNIKGSLKSSIQEINGINFLATRIDMNAGAIKDIAHELGGEVENLFFFAGAENDGKATLTSYIAKNLVEEKGYDAGKIVRELGRLIQGGGGGQKFFATAGGKNPAGLSEAIEKVKEYL